MLLASSNSLKLSGILADEITPDYPNFSGGEKYSREMDSEWKNYGINCVHTYSYPGAETNIN